jgi:hypothetical protein
MTYDVAEIMPISVPFLTARRVRPRGHLAPSAEEPQYLVGIFAPASLACTSYRFMKILGFLSFLYFLGALSFLCRRKVSRRGLGAIWRCR